MLVRCRNETHWLPQLLKSLSMQVGVDLGHVLLVDHESSDRPEELVSLFPNLSIGLIRYEEEYRPGRMLNYGVRHMFETVTRADDDSVLIISAHCFFVDDKALGLLSEHLRMLAPKSRAAYGRQIPMVQSDSVAVRDLALMYPNESRESSQAASFNNAFSLVKYGALRDHLFDEDATNLEDVLWAAEEINLGFSLTYFSGSEVAHHHGPHQGNSVERLQTTRLTIEQHSEVFHFSPASADIDPGEILPVFITNGSNPALGKLIGSILEGRKGILWTESEEVSSDLERVTGLEKIKNLLVVRRDKSIPSSDVSTLYDVLPLLDQELVARKEHANYYLVFDDTYDSGFAHLDCEIAANRLARAYRPALWPVVESKVLYFTQEKDGNFSPNQLSDGRGNWRKTLTYRAMRGNGTVFTRAAMVNPEVAFRDYEFVDLQGISHGISR